MHRCQLRSSRRGTLRILLAICWLSLAFCAEMNAKDKSHDALGPSTSQAAKQEAISAIPLQRISPQKREDLHRVMTNCSLFRRMPTGVIACDPEMFTYLMQHPEMLVEMWRKLGISRVDLRSLGKNQYHLTDNAGTTAKLEIIEEKCEPGAQNRIVMYAEGAYEGKPFKKPVKAQVVLLLRSGSFRETNGQDYVAARLDTFIHIDRTSIELFAKAMHPWVGKTADANFLDTLNFVSNLSQAGARHPSTVEGLVSDLPNISSETKEEMLQLTYESHKKTSLAREKRLSTAKKKTAQGSDNTTRR